MEDFESWYFGQHARVLGACMVLSGELDVAREATDEAFTRALERWARVSRMESPGAWVQTVAFNQLRRLRRRQRLERLFASKQRRTTEIPPTADAELWAAVRGLPSRQRTAVVLRYVADLPEAVIAEQMGVSRGTVASTLHDARIRLRAVVSEPDKASGDHSWRT